MSDQKKTFWEKMKEAAEAAKLAFSDEPKKFTAKINDKDVVWEKFGESKLQDGSILVWEGDEPQPGQPAMIVQADGNQTPAPDGEYTLPETGTIVKIEGGVVASVVPAQAGAEPTNQAANTGMSQAAPVAPQVPKELVERVEKIHKYNEELPAKFEAMEKNISGLSESLATIQKENETLKAENKKLRDGFQSFSSQINEAIKDMGDEPQEEKEKKIELSSNEKPIVKEAEKIVSHLSFR